MLHGPQRMPVRLPGAMVASLSENRTSTHQERRYPMKSEDLWMIGIVAFCILFTASFGWGLWG